MAGGFVRITQDQLKALAEKPSGRVVKPYEQKRISEEGFVRARIPRAESEIPVATKDSRFQVSDLARPYLPMHQEERAAIEAQVRAQVDAIAQETYHAALEKGLQEGRQQGSEQARAEVLETARPMLDAFEALVRDFEGQRKALYDANERFLLDMVLRIARKVCLKETAGDREYIERLARAMIEHAGARENIRVRLNPNQVDAITSMRESIGRALGELKGLQVELSSEVADGACEVETDFSHMSASLDSQIEAIEQALVKA